MWKYKGGGFLPGVPARDLTDEEALAFDEAVLTASGLYEKESDKPKEIKITTRQQREAQPPQGEQEKT